MVVKFKTHLSVQSRQTFERLNTLSCRERSANMSVARRRNGRSRCEYRRERQVQCEGRASLDGHSVVGRRLTGSIQPELCLAYCGETTGKYQLRRRVTVLPAFPLDIPGSSGHSAVALMPRCCEVNSSARRMAEPEEHHIFTGIGN